MHDAVVWVFDAMGWLLAAVGFVLVAIAALACVESVENVPMGAGIGTVAGAFLLLSDLCYLDWSGRGVTGSVLVGIGCFVGLVGFLM